MPCSPSVRQRQSVLDGEGTVKRLTHRNEGACPSSEAMSHVDVIEGPGKSASNWISSFSPNPKLAKQRSMPATHLRVSLRSLIGPCPHLSSTCFDL